MSIRGFMRVKDGFNGGFIEWSSVGIEGEKIGLFSRWFCSPTMASLDLPSFSLPKYSSRGSDLKSFLRDLFWRFKLYALKYLLWSRKFKLLPKSLERICKGRITSSLWGFCGITNLGWIAKAWGWNVCKVAMKTSSSSLGDDSFSTYMISSWMLVHGVSTNKDKPRLTNG